MYPIKIKYASFMFHIIDSIDNIKISQSENNSIISVPVGYSSVGGLDKQIEQIRDLIEIPLTRPDLFRHFGIVLYAYVYE